MPVRLSEVQPSDRYYQNIANQFYNNWRHNKRRPTIRHIFYLLHDSSDSRRHLQVNRAYMHRVGNEKMLFHGTKRTCLTGENSWQTNPCHRSDCALCSILRCDLDVNKAGSNNRYGKGIYTSSVSSKADDYASSTQSRSKCMLYSNVTLGRVQDMYVTWDSSITGPSYGYDSIQGLTTAQGGPLNYPENVVYRNDAICVNSLIVYD